jgi:hypothetical protein
MMRPDVKVEEVCLYTKSVGDVLLRYLLGKEKCQLISLRKKLE